MKARRPILITGVVAFLAALVLVFSIGTRPTPPLPKDRAAPAARSDRGVHEFLVANPPTRVSVIPLDRKHWRVTFWDGQTELLDAAVDPHAKVDAVEQHGPDSRDPGADAAQNRLFVILLVLLFVGALASSRLASLRNLDALVVGLASSTAAVLIDHRLVAPRVWVGAFLLAYMAWRCAAIAFERRQAPPEEEPVPPLFTNARILTLVAGAALAAGVLIVVTSTLPSDVAFAGAAGGTLLNHGTAPYGHLPPDVVHGDTYPPLTYVLYMPVALLWPVRDSFDSLDGALWLNAVALVATAALFWRSRGGVRWALAWLAFPPVLLAASGGGNDLPAAFFATAGVLLLARPVIAAALLTVAGWVKIGPAAALVPTLAALRGAQLRRALAVVVAICLIGFGFLVVIGSLRGAVDGIRFQFDRGSWFSPWQQLGSHDLQLVFEAVTLGLIAAAAAAVAMAPSVRRIAAAGGLTIALLQLAANYWTFAYLPWLLPFILVALFPPARPRSPTPARAAP